MLQMILQNRLNLFGVDLLMILQKIFKQQVIKLMLDNKQEVQGRRSLLKLKVILKLARYRYTQVEVVMVVAIIKYQLQHKVR